MNIIRYAVVGEMILLLACSYFVYWFNKEDLKQYAPGLRWLYVALLGVVLGVAIVVFINSLTTIEPTPGVKVLGVYVIPFLGMGLYAVHVSFERYYAVMNNDESERSMADTNPAPTTPQLKPTKAQVAAVLTLIVAGALVLFTALDDGAVSAQEWVGILLAVLGSPAAVGAGVYHTTNKPK